MHARLSLRSFASLGLVAALAAPLASCETLENSARNALNIPIPVTWTVPVTVPVAYPGNERLAELQGSGEARFPIVSYIPIDLGDVDDRFTDADVVEEVRILGITMQVEENTLTDSIIQPFELRVGDPGTQFLGAEVGGATWDDAIVVGTTPAIAVESPPFTGAVPATMDASGQASAAPRIARLEFGLGMGTELLIPEGEIPDASGKAEVRFTLELEILINPL